MFWRFGGYANISTLDSILDKPDVTVEELLDESDLIQELKQNNSKLIEFLREDANLKKLLAYVVADASAAAEASGSEDSEKSATQGSPGKDKKEEESKGVGISFFGKGKTRSRSKSLSKKDHGDGETEHDKLVAQRKKYAYVGCEVLSSEVHSISEALLAPPATHLHSFWQYIYTPPTLDPLQAGYFTKINETLLDRNTAGMLAFFKSLPGVIEAMLKHVDCPMIMDLLLKIISLEKHEGGQGIVDWLHNERLIPILLGYLSPSQPAATQTSAGDFLKAIITISANATTQDQSVIGPNELTRQLVSEPCIKLLIENMLQGGNPLTVGVGIIIEVIRKNNSDYDLDNQIGPDPKTSDPIYLGTLLRLFAENIPNFMMLVRGAKSSRKGLKVASGGSIEPLGFERFKTCELMAELLHCSNMGLLNERGAQAEVEKRDAERERLRNEGKLAMSDSERGDGGEAAIGEGEDFGSSVDSQGFHHAERPTDDDMQSGSQGLRRLEVQNSSEDDGFEKVNRPDGEAEDAMPDEVSFDDLEATDLAPLSAQSEKRASRPNSRDFGLEDKSAVPRPLSPNKAASSSPAKESAAAYPSPTSPSKAQAPRNLAPAPAADSPTSTGVTAAVESMNVSKADDEDTVMTEFGEDPASSSDEEDTSHLHETDHSNDVDMDTAVEKPAPLFARKSNSPTKSQDEGSKDPIRGSSPSGDQSGENSEDDVDRSVATLHPDTVVTEDDASEQALSYYTEADGRPVVGDLLKMKFVEQHVVPTILDFFFRFPWNNFLHNVVYDIVQQVFNGTLERGYNREVAFDLFRDIEIPEGEGEGEKGGSTTGGRLGLVSTADVTGRILEGQRVSDESQRINKGMRLGYMGHLTLIAEEVCKFSQRVANEGEKVQERGGAAVVERAQAELWMKYVEGTLAETRERDNAVLGGVRPENAVGMRAGLGGGGMQGGFGGGMSNSSALTSAGLGQKAFGLTSSGAAADSMALEEGTVGQSFEIDGGSSGGMLSGFGDGRDDEDEEDAVMMGLVEGRDSGRGSESAFSDDEQVGELSFGEGDMDFR